MSFASSDFNEHINFDNFHGGSVLSIIRLLNNEKK